MVNAALPTVGGEVVRSVRVGVKGDFEKNFAVGLGVLGFSSEIGASTWRITFAPENSFELDFRPAVRRCCVVPRLLHGCLELSMQALSIKPRSRSVAFSQQALCVRKNQLRSRSSGASRHIEMV